jgi:predicted Zn finger-like uncharacterized protein
MLIVCPTCASSYSLTREQLGEAGRTVRCARCRETWFASPESAIPEDGEEDVVVLEGEPGPGAAATLPRRFRLPLPSLAALRGMNVPRPPGAVLALAGLGLLVALLAWQRAAVVHLAPQMARVYAALGMPVNLRGLELADVRSTLAVDQDRPVLLVEGQIRNIRTGETEIPPIKLVLRGQDGREIYQWTAEASIPTLAAGQTTAFRTRLTAPPSEGHDVLVRFADLGPDAGQAR